MASFILPLALSSTALLLPDRCFCGRSCCLSLERDRRLCSVRPLLALLLASTFLALLLTSAAGKSTHEALRLIRNPSDGVLHPLDSLPGLVGYLACGLLRSSALLLLLRPATTLGL